ncbi:MAG: glycosyltransferase [Proteobacteria bacterium]|nr:glycosyltransferase [Desulfobacterales bacterium]MBL6967044.1 glycosyltransferase [Desulfobacteraceae bacterium]MBL7171679.1 glycosyltransferase [Desulfobacteraceae bacterium]MBU1903164.1 glycosyltransferase [Pseudomonadota bacterium]
MKKHILNLVWGNNNGGPAHETRKKTVGLAWLVVVCYLIILTFLTHLIRHEFVYAVEEFYDNSSGKILILTTQFLMAVSLAIFIWRLFLVLMYRPAKTCTDEQLPSCTVIVPAYNEGPQVLHTIRSIANSDYPLDRFSIIGIDDGSLDDTWHWLETAAAEFPGRVTILRQPVNSGKRHALYRGFRMSNCDIYVTVDSDSQVEPLTIRRLVSPFYWDQRVGAVAGNVRVLNRNDGIIPSMLEVLYAYSFDFIRTSQSMVNTVLCTPGALSAYRRDIVAGVLDEWLNQKFFGRPANIGEDRFMTNLILRNGYHVLFQQNAMVYTAAPTQYPDLCRMFLRWARSNIRETIVMSRFAFRRFRRSPATGARINLLQAWLNMIVGQFMKVVGLWYLILTPELVAINMLVGAAIAAIAPGVLYAIRYRIIDAIWAWPYGVFWMFGLSWIALFALVTPHKTGWLTRRTTDIQKNNPLSFHPVANLPQSFARE